MSTPFLRKISVGLTLLMLMTSTAQAGYVYQGGNLFQTPDINDPNYYTLLADNEVSPVITEGKITPATFNPSNGEETFIHFKLSTPAWVRVEILNPTTGAQVKKIFEQFDFVNSQPHYVAAGTFDFNWNGLSNSNALVLSGTYKYRIFVQNGAGSQEFSGFLTVANNNSQLLNLTVGQANPTSINPDVAGNNQTTVQYTLNAAANLNIDIIDYNTNLPLNQQTSLVQLSPSPFSQNAGTYTVTWNGRDKNGTKLAAKTYYFRFSANNTSVPSPILTTTPITVTDSTNPGTPNDAKITYAYAEPSSFNPSTNTLKVHFGVDKQTTAYVKIYSAGSNNVIKTLAAKTANTGVDNLVTWDGTTDNNGQAPNGDYYARVEVSTACCVMSDSEQTNTFTLTNSTNNTSKPNITSISVNPVSFDPSNGSTTITYYIDKAADNAKVEIIDANGTTRRTFNNTGTNVNSANNVSWNGRDDNGNTLSNGTYVVKVTATNAAGSNTGTASVVLTNNGNGNTDCNNSFGTPNISKLSTDPSTYYDPNNDPLATIYYNIDRTAYVSIEVVSNGNVIRTLLDNACRFYQSSDQSVTWNGKDKNGNVVNNGSYQIRVRAHTNSGVEDVEYTYLEITDNGGNNNNGNIISNFMLMPDVFNPYNNGSTTAYYNLNKSSYVTVEVTDQNGNQIRKVVDNSYRTYGNSNYNNGFGSYQYADKWYGTYTNGSRVPDGIYKVTVKASTSSNFSGETDTESGWVEVDTDGVLIGFPNGSTCAGFKDVSIYGPYCKAIEAMKNLGVFSGYPDGTFRPYQQINRAETTKVILLALDIPTDSSYYNLGFTDTNNNAWYAPYVRSAKTRGIVQGYPDNSFRPDQTVNRVELLKVFLKTTGVNIPTCNVAPYSDTPITTETRWYIDFVCFAKNNNLMHDDGYGRFNPAAPMTRGDVADLFYQAEMKGLTNGTYYGGYYNNNYYCDPYSNNYNNYNCNYYNNNNYNYNQVANVSSLSMSKNSFDPDVENLNVYYTLDKAASSVRVDFIDSNNNVRRSIYNNGTAANTSYTVSWNGRDNYGYMLPNGTYTVKVYVTNGSSSSYKQTTVYLQ